MKDQNGKTSEDFRLLRRITQFGADIIVLSIGYLIACLPAVNIQLREFSYDVIIRQLPFVILVQISVLIFVGASSIIWRYISIEDVKVFIRAAVISAAILLLYRLILGFTEYSGWLIPISVILIDTVMAFVGLLALRILRRLVHELNRKNKRRPGRRHLKKKPTLVVGAGSMGVALVKEMSGRVDGELDIVGFVDDDPRKVGGSISGLKVLGKSDDLSKLVDEFGIKQVVVAISQIQSTEIRRIMSLCSEIPVRAQIVPSLDEIAHGEVSVSRIRDVQIEDLLGRQPVELDNKNIHNFLAGKIVMVTGAGGSIGSELVRQITGYNPKKILLVERAEYALFKIGLELAADFAETECVPLIADIGDESRMREIFERYGPSVIFHAAAYKHVPLMEINPAEAIKNNVFATRLLGRLAGEYRVSDFVMISTDKAVNPTSIMGASKRVAEIVVQALNRSFATKYVAVRFGNVLDSAGSVVPIFREQIKKGETITVTHKDMTRYFMTIPEASQLVLQAGALGEGGEIFILDMGQPVRILDLAEDMIRLSGLIPYEDIDIEFTGIRDGEKLFEELGVSDENLLKTRNRKIFIGEIAPYASDEVEKMVERFQAAVAANDEEAIRRAFGSVLPENATVLSATKS